MTAATRDALPPGARSLLVLTTDDAPRLSRATSSAKKSDFTA
jgi:hypothetical protein